MENSTGFRTVFRPTRSEVMATQNSKPSGQVSSPTTPTGEESVTPIPQPSGLGALSASMSIEPERKTEAIQKAQVGSLMGANGNNEPPNKSPKRQTPASGARLKRYSLEMWVEIDTGVGVHAALRRTHTVLILPSTVSIEPTLGVLVCT